MRSVPGAPVPEEWLDHCDMGAILLEDLNKSDPQRLPKDHQKLAGDRAWVAEEMERRRHVYWEEASADRYWAKPGFPYVEFLDMLQTMMTLDVTKWATMYDVAQHEFWKRFDPGQCRDWKNPWAA